VKLDGKTGYVGFRIQVGDAFHYGWMRIAISSTNGCTMLEYQYNEKPNEGISAGADCSVALSVEDNTASVPFVIKPNPMQDKVIIDCDNHLIGKGKLIVSTINGMQVATLNITQSSQELSLNDIASGVYIISMHDEFGMLVYSQALIKQ
jgi:hypothetical protein